MSEAALVLAFLMVLTCGGGTLLWLPRPVAPVETPGLHFARRELSEAAARDETLARAAPSGDAVERLDAMERSLGAAELGEANTSVRGQTQGLTALLSELARDQGPEVVDALRARAAIRMETALSDLDSEEHRLELGQFPAMLDRYGARIDGEVVAPSLVLRGLYKARWNQAHGRRATSGLSDVELEGYWGWLALESHGTEASRRLAALERYEAVTHQEHGEARAVLMYLSGRAVEASALLTAARERHDSLRLRNHVFAAEVAAAR